MLMKEDAASVITAFEIVLEKSQDSIAKLKEEWPRQENPKQALKEVCDCIEHTCEKIEKIKEYCQHVGNTPAPIGQIIEEEYLTEEADEKKKRFQKPRKVQL